MMNSKYFLIKSLSSHTVLSSALELPSKTKNSAQAKWEAEPGTLEGAKRMLSSDAACFFYKGRKGPSGTVFTILGS